jgi:transposase
VEPTQEQFYQQRIAALEAENASLREQLLELQAQMALVLEQNAKLSKNSSNSSKPPSSDIVKPPKPPPPSGPRKTGGQPGHLGSHHQPFSESQLNDHWEQAPRHCPRGHDLAGQPVQTPKILQQVELAKDPVVRTEYRRPGVGCPICDEIVYAELPAGVIDGQLFGPRLLALLGYMKGSLHTTYSGLECFCRDVLGIEVSRGHLGNALARVSAALAPAYQELAAQVPTEPVLNIDESGWKDRGIKYWIWIFATTTVSFFVIARSRSSRVLRTVLGEAYRGTLVSDFFSAYVKYANGLQQFCLAHLIRDTKFTAELPDPAERAFGKALLIQFKRLFHF